MKHAARTLLSVNVNKVALLRNSRHGEVPSVVHAARLALDAGAHGITVHPRPDQRHIRPYDVDALAELLRSPEYRGREFNIEGNPLDFSGGGGTSGAASGGEHLMRIMRRIRPTQATLVPDAPGQNTSDHGFALTEPAVVRELKPYVAELADLGCRVSLFVDPDPATARAAGDCGAHRVELYTETYARAHGSTEHAAVLDGFVRTAAAAEEAGLGINAGHDLNLTNLPAFVAAIPRTLEVSIGHALVADALERGMAGAVRAYLACLK